MMKESEAWALVKKKVPSYGAAGNPFLCNIIDRMRFTTELKEQMVKRLFGTFDHEGEIRKTHSLYPSDSPVLFYTDTEEEAISVRIAACDTLIAQCIEEGD
jgi:hypothetical protein